MNRESSASHEELKLKRRTIAVSVSLLTLFGGFFVAPYAQATVTTEASSSTRDTNLYQVADSDTADPAETGNGAYVEPTNTFSDGDVTRWLLTQDENKEGYDQTVTVDGVDYPVLAANVILSDDLSAAAAAGAMNDDQTLFVDPGTYTSTVEATAFSHTNFSLVGLGSVGDVTLTRVPNDDGVINRYLVGQQNVYIGNIVFDGGGGDVVDTAGLWYAWVVDGSNGSGDRDAAANFVMKDCAITNVGSGAGENGALEVRNDEGLHHFVNLTIDNIETISPDGPLVLMTQSADSYFENLQVVVSDVMGSGPVVRVSKDIVAQDDDPNGFSGLTGGDNEDSAVFAGGMTISPEGQDFIQIDDYQFGVQYVDADNGELRKPISAPQDYRYVQYMAPSWGAVVTAEGAHFGMYRIWRDIQDSFAAQLSTDNPEWGQVGCDFGCYSGDAWLDRTDNYWVVRQGDDYPSVTDQIAFIAEVREAMTGLLGPDSDAVPPANIKLVVAPGQSIENFDVLGFPAGEPINIVAVESGDDGAIPSVDPQTVSSPVPVAVGFESVYGGTDMWDVNGLSSGWCVQEQYSCLTHEADVPAVTLGNFDFAQNAGYTLQETVDGTSALTATDPYDADYPAGDGLTLSEYATSTDPVITNVDGSAVMADQFMNCTFVGLNAGTDDTLTKLTVDGPSFLTVGGTGTMTATGDFYTVADEMSTNGDPTVDDPTVMYFASDDTIATVDPNTGDVTGVKPGTVTIYVKAVDTNNQGEIEKPYGEFNVTVVSALTAEDGTGAVTVTTLPPTAGTVTVANNPVADPSGTVASTSVGDVMDAAGDKVDGFTLTQADPDDPSAGWVVTVDASVPAGTYTVDVTYTDSFGQTVTVTDTITVTVVTPTVPTASDGSGQVKVDPPRGTPGTVTITNDPGVDSAATLASTSVGDVLDSAGDKVDGFTLTQADPDDPAAGWVVTVDASVPAGTYTVDVTYTDSFGQTVTVTDTITVGLVTITEPIVGGGADSEGVTDQGGEGANLATDVRSTPNSASAGKAAPAEKAAEAGGSVATGGSAMGASASVSLMAMAAVMLFAAGAGATVVARRRRN